MDLEYRRRLSRVCEQWYEARKNLRRGAKLVHWWKEQIFYGWALGTDQTEDWSIWEGR